MATSRVGTCRIISYVQNCALLILFAIFVVGAAQVQARCLLLQDATTWLRQQLKQVPGHPASTGPVGPASPAGLTDPTVQSSSTTDFAAGQGPLVRSVIRLISDPHASCVDQGSDSSAFPTQFNGATIGSCTDLAQRDGCIAQGHILCPMTCCVESGCTPCQATLVAVEVQAEIMAHTLVDTGPGTPAEN